MSSTQIKQRSNTVKLDGETVTFTEGETIYEVSPNMMQSFQNRFSPKQDTGYYCLMWGNPAENPISLNLRFKVLKP